MRSKTPNLPISTTRPKAILINRKIDKVIDGISGSIFGGFIGMLHAWEFFIMNGASGFYPMPHKPYLCAGVITLIWASVGCMICLNES